MKTKIKPKTVTEYINFAPQAAKEKLLEIRAILKEAIKWGSAVFIKKRMLFAFTAHKSFLSFMPTGQTLQCTKDVRENDVK